MYYASELCTPRGTKETFYGTEMTISLDDLPLYFREVSKNSCSVMPCSEYPVVLNGGSYSFPFLPDAFGPLCTRLISRHHYMAADKEKTFPHSS